MSDIKEQETIYLSHCPICNHFPTQLIANNGLEYGRHLTGADVHLAKEYDCPASEMNTLKEAVTVLTLKLEWQVAYGALLHDGIDVLSTHCVVPCAVQYPTSSKAVTNAIGLLKKNPSPELTKQFQADAVHKAMLAIAPSKNAKFKGKEAFIIRKYLNRLGLYVEELRQQG